MAKPADFDGYLDAVPEEMHASIERLREITRSVAPTALETISYDMPTFKYEGRPLVYFGVWKSHCALYGLAFEEHSAELAEFERSKGTLRFSPSQPFPEELFKTLLRERMAAIEDAVAARKTKSSGTRRTG